MTRAVPYHTVCINTVINIHAGIKCHTVIEIFTKNVAYVVVVSCYCAQIYK